MIIPKSNDKNNSFVTEKYSYLHYFFSKDIKYYFDVDNNYVINKLKIILLPFLYSGEWTKQSHEYGENHLGYLEPKTEVHAPDLYIPLMAFMSYVLISCFSMGVGDQ